MTISRKIEDKVKNLPIGATFTYQALAVNSNEYGLVSFMDIKLKAKNHLF